MCIPGKEVWPVAGHPEVPPWRRGGTQARTGTSREAGETSSEAGETSREARQTSGASRKTLQTGCREVGLLVTPGEEGLETADRGSRDYHPDDISLDFDSMSKVFEDFGCFDVDTFATASNTKGNRFFSRLDVPGSAGVNFFHQRWGEKC